MRFSDVHYCQKVGDLKTRSYGPVRSSIFTVHNSTQVAACGMSRKLVASPEFGNTVRRDCSVRSTPKNRRGCATCHDSLGLQNGKTLVENEERLVHDDGTSPAETERDGFQSSLSGGTQIISGEAACLLRDFVRYAPRVHYKCTRSLLMNRLQRPQLWSDNLSARAHL